MKIEKTLTNGQTKDTIKTTTEHHQNKNKYLLLPP